LISVVMISSFGTEPAPMAASMPLTGRSVQAGLSQPGRQATPKGRGAAQAAGAEANGFDQHRALRQKTCISRGRLAGLPATKGRCGDGSVLTPCCQQPVNSRTWGRLRAVNPPRSGRGGRRLKFCYSDLPPSQGAEPARFLTFTRHHAENSLLGIERPKAGVRAFLARNAKTTDKA
jgi:hypothetical protein